MLGAGVGILDCAIRAGGNASVTAPTNFAFTPASGAAVGTPQTASYTVSGLSAPQAISISNGTYSKNGAAYTSSPGTVTNADVVTVKGTASSSYNTAVLVPVTIGTGSATFTITTETITATSPLYSDDFNSYANNVVLVGGTGNTAVSNPFSWSSVGGTVTTYYLRPRVVSSVINSGTTTPTASGTDFTSSAPNCFGTEFIYKDLGVADHFFEVAMTDITAAPSLVVAGADERNAVRVTSGTGHTVEEAIAGTKAQVGSAASWATTNRFNNRRAYRVGDRMRIETYGGKVYLKKNDVLIGTVAGYSHTRTGTKVGYGSFNSTWSLTDNYVAGSVVGQLAINETLGQTNYLKRFYARIQGQGGYTKGARDITVSGTYVGTAPTSLQWALFDPISDKQLTGWATATSQTISAGTWTGTLKNVPAGLTAYFDGTTRGVNGTDYPYAVTAPGAVPYRLAVRASNDIYQVAMSQTTFGVGYCIAGIGQSMTGAVSGSATGGFIADHPGCFVFKGTDGSSADVAWAVTSTWESSTSEGTAADNSIGALTKMVSEAQNMSVGYIYCGKAGTSAASLGPGGTQWTLVQALLTLAGAFDTFYFDQGQWEADNAAVSPSSLTGWASQWVTNITAYIPYSNQPSGTTIPLYATMLGKPGSSTPTTTLDDGSTALRTAQANIASTIGTVSVAGVSVVAHLGAHPVNIAIDGTVHFDPASATGSARVVRRWGLTFLYNELGVGSYDGLGPRVSSISRSGAVLTVTMNLNGASSLTTNTGATSGLTGWQASTSSSFASTLTISSVTISANVVTITLSADPGQAVYVRSYAGYNPTTTIWVVGNYDNVDRAGTAGTMDMQPTIPPVLSS